MVLSSNLLLPLAVGAGVLLSVVIFFYGVAQTLGAPSAVQSRLDPYGKRTRSLEEIEMSLPFTDRILRPLLRSAAQVFVNAQPEKSVAEIRHKLELAGNPYNWTPTEFLGVRVFCTVVFMLLSGWLFNSLHYDAALVLLFIGIGAILGFYAPLFWLNLLISRRKDSILRSLPDALDLLTISIEAGLGFDAALQKVVDKWDDELSREFERALREMQMGKLRREALRDLANRTDVPDVNNFIAAILQADQLGVSMAKVMRIQSEQMRIKRRQRAEEKAREAPVKMMIPLAFLVFPSILIILLGPAVLLFISGNAFK